MSPRGMGEKDPGVGMITLHRFSWSAPSLTEPVKFKHANSEAATLVENKGFLFSFRVTGKTLSHSEHFFDVLVLFMTSMIHSRT